MHLFAKICERILGSKWMGFWFRFRKNSFRGTEEQVKRNTFAYV